MAHKMDSVGEQHSKNTKWKITEDAKGRSTSVSKSMFLNSLVSHSGIRENQTYVSSALTVEITHVCLWHFVPQARLLSACL